MPVRGVEDGIVPRSQRSQEAREAEGVPEGVGLLERNDPDAEAFGEGGAAGGEEQVHLRPGQRLAQRERERDREQRVSHPVVGTDYQDARDAIGSREPPV